MLNSDIDGAVHCFTQVLLSVAQCMQCTFKSGVRKARGPKWFDNESRRAKQDACKALVIARESGLASDRLLFVGLRNASKKSLEIRRIIIQTCVKIS